MGRRVRHRGIFYITRHTLFLHAIRLGSARHARSDQTRLQDHTEARMIRWRESTHPPTSPDTQTHPRDIIPDAATASHPIPSLRDFTTQHHIPRVASLTRTHTAGRSWYPPSLVQIPGLHRLHFFPPQLNSSLKQCLVVERVVKVSARVVPSATARFCATTSRVSPSPLSVVSPVVVVLSVSRV